MLTTPVLAKEEEEVPARYHVLHCIRLEEMRTEP